MAEEKVDARDTGWRQAMAWTELFRGFQVAFDPRKLLLAAAGIVVMACGWWFLSWIFFFARSTAPVESDFTNPTEFKIAYERWQLLEQTAGPGGTLRTLPWDEDRGPNPYLLVTDPEQRRWSQQKLETEGKVLLEPLVKFLTPIIHFLKPEAAGWNRFYLLLVFLWTALTWGFFGGAITRMAAVQLTRREKISIREALRFTAARYVSFVCAPLVPLLIVAAIVVFLMIFGLFHLIPVIGDILVDGLGWPLVLLAGLVMAMTLIGLVAWPLMYTTISTEGSDSFDALSRSYSYLFQCPWSCLWYGVVALSYGAVLVFFVGFVGSFLVYLGKWGVTQTTQLPYVERADRDPEFLFVFAPKSFGWRELLLKDTSVPLDAAGNVDPDYLAGLSWWNMTGAIMVSFWLHLAFLMVLGFGYSYFWTASTIIYLLLRRKVDDTDLDEIYLEEDEADEFYSEPVETSASSPAPAAPLQMVDPPALRQRETQLQPTPPDEENQVTSATRTEDAAAEPLPATTTEDEKPEASAAGESPSESNPENLPISSESAPLAEQPTSEQEKEVGVVNKEPTEENSGESEEKPAP
ncbi:MAG: hypothetical protein KatS3mg105_2916 [Gemmatales bacterium]|nr:MAG: hypothetical protein KatS3mg105_2916 [Gemmatales bacterium]